MSRIFVKNLPKQTNEQTLRDLFGQKGRITDCSLKYTADGQFRRFAFIGFSTEEEAKAAQQYFDKTYIRTSKIHVEAAVEFSNSRPRSWSKYSKVQSPEKASDPKTKKQMQAEMKKKKQEEKDAALLGDLHQDPEFKEYLKVHSADYDWNGNEANDNRQQKENEDEDESDEKSDDDESENEKDEDNKETNTTSDLDFLKSKMADSTLLSSDEEDGEEDKGSGQTKSSPQKGSTEQAAKGSEKGSSPQKNSKGDGTTDTKGPKPKFCLKMKGLPAAVKSNRIREFFMPLKVKVNLPVNKNKHSVGIAFVECRSEKDLQQALEKNKSFIGKKKIFLHRVFEETPKEKVTEKKPKPWEQKTQGDEEEESIAESGRLFVRNLPYVCTEEPLEELFKKYGPLTDFDLPVDSMTKKVKGFAHVTYMFPEHAVKAFTELDGKSFMGRLLHILPGKDNEAKYVSTEKSSYKKQKDEKMKALVKRSHNWNTLFLSQDAIATAMATRYQTEKGDIWDDNAKGSLGVRMALGETQLVQETRQFLIDNGVALDSFSQADGELSKTVFLVKDLPAATQADELLEVFSKYGAVTRVLLPPQGVAALIEFQEPSEARRAFSKLGYRRFKDRPLYLQWAPMAVFNKDSEQKETESGEHMETEEAADEKTEKTADIPAPVTEATQKEESDSEEENVPGATLYVRNLNFDTQEAALREVFSKAGEVRHVTISKKKDMKNPGKFLSMGYGFVGYKTADMAKEALKILQNHVLDGHQLQLKISHREILEPKTSRKKQSSKQKGSTKILVRNIPFQCNKKELTELFKVFGELKFVHLPKKVRGQGSRGFAFVDFMTKQDAKRAFNALCHSTHLFGRRLVLEWANMEETVEDLQRKTAQKFYDGAPPSKLRKKDIMQALE